MMMEPDETSTNDLKWHKKPQESKIWKMGQNWESKLHAYPGDLHGQVGT